MIHIHTRNQRGLYWYHLPPPNISIIMTPLPPSYCLFTILSASGGCRGVKGGGREDVNILRTYDIHKSKYRPVIQRNISLFPQSPPRVHCDHPPLPPLYHESSAHMYDVWSPQQKDDRHSRPWLILTQKKKKRKKATVTSPSHPCPHAHSLTFNFSSRVEEYEGFRSVCLY